MGRQRCLPCARRGFLTGWRESEAIQREKSEETLLEVCKILLNSLPDKSLPLYVVNFLPRSLEAGENDFYYPGDFSMRNGVLNRKNSNS